MGSKQIISKVWIEEGCIVCDACETAAPDVFEVLEETCIIRPAALEVEFCKPRSTEIVDAAEECPVDVIKFESTTVEVGDDEAAAAPSASEAAPAPAPAAPAAAPAEAAAPAKAAPAPAPTPAPVAPTAPAHASTAGSPDPAIAALLKAATTRGGHAGIMKNADGTMTGGAALRGDAKNLAPEARQAKVQAAAKKVAAEADAGRRAFASGGALMIGWGAFGVGTGLAVGPAFARFMMPNVLEEPDPRIRLGKLQKYTEMAPGDVNEDFKPQGIWMIRLEDRIAALNIICTHLGCIPNWLVNERKFKCPCHGSGYYQNGVNFEGPTPRPLERFKIYVEDGIVIVDKSKKYNYELGQWDQPSSYLQV